MKKFGCVELWNHNDWDTFSNILEIYDIKTLEQLALELYENNLFFDFSKEYLGELLDSILFERSIRLNKNYVWTDENTQKIINTSELFVSASKKACMYAKSIADKLEQEKPGNIFLTDYEIEIKLIPYLTGYRDVENKNAVFLMLYVNQLVHLTKIS